MERQTQTPSLIRCDQCANGHLRPAHRSQVEDKGPHHAVIFDVPVLECESCGEIWIEMDVAKRLDQMFTDMLEADSELTTRHYEAAA